MAKENRPQPFARQIDQDQDEELSAEAQQAAGQMPTQQRPADQFRSSSVPLPNLRESSEDIEAELAAAMGETSIDQIADSAVEEPTRFERGTKLHAKVVSMHQDNVFVDLGARCQGIVQLKTFGEKLPEVDQPLEVVVSRFDENEGLYHCNLPGEASDAGDWSAISEGMIVTAQVTGTNKGGLECSVGNIRGFMPAGQVSVYRVENLEQLVGEKFNALIVECKPERKNLVLSRRSVMEQERAEAQQKLREELEVGQIREGTVRNIREFGAFVDLGGLDGLLHISQLSWARIKHPSEVLEVGQPVKVKITRIDPESGKISLSLRDLQQNPWSQVPLNYPIGSTARGRITRLEQFGAFVELEPGIEGLIHISELDSGRVWRVSDVVSEGEPVEVKIVSLDIEKRRIGLSRKALLAPTAPAPQPADQPPAEQEETPEEDSASQVRKRKQPLKGGLRGGSGGDDVGLNL